MGSHRTRLKRSHRDKDIPGEHTRKKAAASAQDAAALAEKKEKRKKDNRINQQNSRKRKRAEMELGQASDTANPLSERTKRGLVRTNALALLKSIEGRSMEDQMDILEGTFDHELLREVRERRGIPTRKQREVQDIVFEQTVSALKALGGKGTQSADARAARNAVLAASTGSPVKKRRLERAFANALKQPRSAVSWAINRRGQLKQGHSFWALTQRAKRSDALSEEVKEKVILFWARETRVSPNKKDVVRHRLGPKQHETHPAHLLEISQVRFTTAVVNLCFYFLEKENLLVLSCNTKGRTSTQVSLCRSTGWLSGCSGTCH